MASGALLSLGGQVGTMAFGVAVYILLARLLAPSELGEFLSIAAVVTFSALTARLGLGPLLVRGIAGEAVREGVSGGRSAVLRGAVTVIGAALVLSIGASLFISGVLGYSVEPWGVTGAMVIVAFFWIGGLAMEGIVAEAFRGLGEVGHAAWVFRLGALGITSAVLAVALISGARVTVDQITVIVAGASTFVSGIGLVAVLSMLQRHEPGTSGSVAEIVTVRGAFPIWISDLSGYAATNIGLWIVILLGTSANVAEYGVSMRVVAPVAVPLVVVNGFVTPMIASLYSRHDRVTLERVLRSTATAASAISIIGTVLLIVIAPFLLGSVFGPHYTSAYPLVVILAIGALLNVISGSPGATLLMTGRQRIFAWITMLTVVVGFLLAAVGYWTMGIVGVALAASLTTVLRFGSMAIVVKHLVGVWTVPYFQPRTGIESIRSLRDVPAVTARWGRA